MCTYTALTMTWCVSHCRKNRAKCGSVCVANHTTPIDIVMLAVDNSFTLVGLFGELLTSTADCYALHCGTSIFDDQYHVCDLNLLTTPFQVGQRHGGFTGIIQHACNLAQSHIWFERKVAKDRKMVTER